MVPIHRIAPDQGVRIGTSVPLHLLQAHLLGTDLLHRLLREEGPAIRADRKPRLVIDEPALARPRAGHLLR